MDSRQLLDVSWESILKVFLTGLVFYLLFLVRDVVIWFVFALIITVLLSPAINFLRRLRVPRVLATISIYLAIFGIFGSVFFLTAPMFVFEIQQFSQFLPQYFDKINPFFQELGIRAFESLDSFSKALIITFKQVSAGIFNALIVVFGGVSSTLFILTIAFFLSLEERGVEQAIVLLSPKAHEDSVLRIFKKCQNKVSGWFGARILACLFVGILTFIVLLLFNIKYTFIFSLLAALLNFIPFLGSLFTAALLFIFIAVIDSFSKAIVVLAAFALIQYIEGQILSPILAKKLIGLPPVLVLIALVIGGKTLGLLGAIFAVPVAGIIYEFIRDFLKTKKEEAAIL